MAGATPMPVLSPLLATPATVLPAVAPVVPRLVNVPARRADDADEIPPPSSIRAFAVEPDSTPAPTSVAPIPLEGLEGRQSAQHEHRGRWKFFATVAAMVMVALITQERTAIRHVMTNLKAAFAKGISAMRRSAVPQLSAAGAATGIPVKVFTASAGPCPPEMALVTRDDVRVCVDRWEATVVEIGSDGREKNHSSYLACDGLQVKAVSKPGVVPQGYISRDQAESACTEAGKRLCSPVEWQTACQGPEQTKYPYGETVDDRACNSRGKAPLTALFSSYGDQAYDVHVMNDPSLNALEGSLAKTGEFDRCANGWGLFDMVGNLHEWTSEKRGVFRGGYYLDTTLNGEGCHYATTAHFASYHDYSTGFRCCKDPE